MSERGLVLDGVGLSRAGHVLLSIDAAVTPGAVLTVMGPSGVGKSTLLSLISGHLEAGFEATGDVRLDGQSVLHLPAHQRGIGMLFQDDLLFPHLSVGANLGFGMAPGGSRAARRMRIAAALEEIGLEGYAPRDPATLSGGQRARVALMRVLLSEPRALLLDEAFSALDEALRAKMRELVFGEAARRGLPTLMVTHDEGDAAAAGGDVIRLKGRG